MNMWMDRILTTVLIGEQHLHAKIQSMELKISHRNYCQLTNVDGINLYGTTYNCGKNSLLIWTPSRLGDIIFMNG